MRSAPPRWQSKVERLAKRLACAALASCHLVLRASSAGLRHETRPESGASDAAFAYLRRAFVTSDAMVLRQRRQPHLALLLAAAACAAMPPGA